MVVMRHPNSGAPDIAAQYVKASIINAGDGWHAHPTQALLDIYTISERKSTLKGLKAVIIGDILHSRVARSNLWAMTTMGMEVTLCGPPTLLPDDMAKQNYHLPQTNIEHNIERALQDADVVMTLRLQLERQKSGLLPSIREYVQLYQLTEARLKMAKSDALVMHPGPVNEEIEIAPAIVHSPQSVINEQVTNGVAVRMALLYILAGSQKQ
jgi:aspartate carbamoyltransferase catalytic subunit